MKIIITEKKEQEESPKEKAIRELKEVQRKKALLEKANDDTNEDEVLSKEPMGRWQKDIAEFLPGKKVFAVSKIRNENGAVYFEGENLEWNACVKKEGAYFFATISITDKINFDIYGCNYHNLKIGLEIIKKAVEKCV